jgi:hypothetical protein
LFCKRLDYLDRAFKTLGLSLGLPDADEISRLEDTLGLTERSGDLTRPLQAAWRVTSLHRRPLSGGDAHVLVAIAEGGVTQVFGLPPVTPDTRFLDVPGLGRTAVRIILRNPALNPVLRMEDAGLVEVDSYLLCEVNTDQLQSVMLLGWAGRQDILGSPKVRLADGQPEVYLVELAALEKA